MQRLFLFSFVFLIAAAAAAPVDHEVSVSCAACQMAAHLHRKDTNFKEGEEHLISQASVDRHCAKIEGCSIALTHCQIVSKLADVPVNLPGLGNGTAQYEQALLASLNNFFEESRKTCTVEPNAAIITGNAQSIKCSLCILIYNFFKYLHGALVDNPLVSQMPDVVQLTCILVSGILKIDSPAYCQILTNGQIWQDIFNGIDDSLGSFYDLVAVEGFGCYPYQQLFSDCGY